MTITHSECVNNKKIKKNYMEKSFLICKVFLIKTKMNVGISTSHIVIVGAIELVPKYR